MGAGSLGVTKRLESRRIMPGALLFSLAAHAALLFLLPGWAPWPVRHSDDYVEVELNLGEQVDVSALPALPAGEPVGGATADPAAAADAVSSQPAAVQSNPLTGPGVELPLSAANRQARQAFDSVPLPALREQQAVAQPLPEGPRRTSFGGALGAFAVKGPGRLPPPVSAPLADQALPQPLPQQARGGKSAPSHSIQGPAAQRTVLYQPPPPPVRIEVETEIQLKFWLQPDGRVGRVIPLIKGDAKLEEQMIVYLKSWIFDRVADNGSSQEVWGILTIRFRLT